MKHKNKVAKLEARRKAYDAVKEDERRRFHLMHRPGSLKK